MNKKLTLREVQIEELNILKEVIKTLDEQKIPYYLYGGTLLGAVRHKGFIPWDDDIDICMLRKDYEKFLNYARKINMKLKENLKITSYELSNGIYPFCKVENTNYEVDEECKLDKYLWIDIFALDALPNNEKKRKKMMKKHYILFHMICLKEMKFKDILNNKSKSLKIRIAKLILKICTIFISKKYLINKKISDMKKYNSEDIVYVANLATSNKNNGYFKKSNYKLKEMQFEDIKVNGIEDYDEVLTNQYGNYMEVPPENKRITHSMDVYYINK